MAFYEITNDISYKVEALDENDALKRFKEWLISENNKLDNYLVVEEVEE